MVGIPASGKSYLAKNLASNLPLVFLSENDIQSFLVPKTSFAESGQATINQFAKATIKRLIKLGYSCIFDANLRTVKLRDESRSVVEKAGGRTIVIYLNCPKQTAYERIKRRNAEIVAGTVRGFAMDWDYLHYEINTTQEPLRLEKALTFDSSQADHQMGGIISYLKSKIV